MTATRLMLSAALLLPCCSTLAQTDTDSGNYMLQHCKRHGSRRVYPRVFGNCAGVISTLMWSSEQFRRDAAFCVPRTVTKRAEPPSCPLLHGEPPGVASSTKRLQYGRQPLIGCAVPSRSRPMAASSLPDKIARRLIPPGRFTRISSVRAKKTSPAFWANSAFGRAYCFLDSFA
jgi:hypothetical protein